MQIDIPKELIEMAKVQKRNSPKKKKIVEPNDPKVLEQERRQKIQNRQKQTLNHIQKLKNQKQEKEFEEARRQVRLMTPKIFNFIKKEFYLTDVPDRPDDAEDVLEYEDTSIFPPDPTSGIHEFLGMMNRSV